MTYITTRLARLLHDEGGWIGAALAGAGLLGKIFGGQAKGAADGRAAESDLIMRQDLLRNQQFNTAQDAQMQAGQMDLQRKGFTEDARGGRAKQAAIADMLSNFTPTQVSVPGIQNAQISGGMKLGAGGKAGMAELMKQALAAQMAGADGENFTGGQLLKAPGVSALPQASGWEKAAGLLGTLGTLGGAVGSLLPGQPDAPQFSALDKIKKGTPAGQSPGIYEGLF